MAYETGIATGVNDLITKLQAFLGANGWTINRFAAMGNGYQLCVQKGEVFQNIRSYSNESIPSTQFINAQGMGTGYYGLALIGSTGFASGSNWRDQPGRATRADGTTPSGGYVYLLSGAIPRYHFFTYADTTEFYGVVEWSANTFYLFSFGQLTKFNPAAEYGQWSSAPLNYYTTPAGDSWAAIGSYEFLPFTVGVYSSTTSRDSSQLRVNAPGFNAWANTGAWQNTSNPAGAISNTAISRDLLNSSQNPLGWQTQLIPEFLSVVSNNEARLRPFGSMKHYRTLNISSYQPAEEFSLGHDVWKVFPAYVKGGITAKVGYAIRKVV